MRLSELEAKFLIIEPNGIRRYSDVLEGSDGVIFLCPKCYQANNGKIGTHSIICWFVGKVPDDLDPKPGRWNSVGTNIEDLTFVGPGATSVELKGEDNGCCRWHGHVVSGDAT